MNTEQERAEFEAWAQNSFELHRHSAGEYSSNFTQTAWAAWQAGRAALQSQEYTAAIGEAGQAYLDRFKNAHALPAEFRWSELWAVMCVAANKGRTDALQSQPMPPEISRDLLGKIVDEVFDGAIEDASVIEDIYRVVARECALQSQDREDALRYRWLRDSALLFSQIEQRGVSGWMVGRRDHVKTRFYTYNGKELDEAIDHARRAEGNRNDE